MNKKLMLAISVSILLGTGFAQAAAPENELVIINNSGSSSEENEVIQEGGLLVIPLGQEHFNLLKSK